MIVSLSTGSVSRVADTVLAKIHFIEKEFLELIDGVEICFIHKKDFEEFELDHKSINFLNGLKFNTLHAPVREITYDKNNETKAIFEKIKKINELINIQYVTIHPTAVKDFSVLPANDLNICIENMPNGEKRKRWQYPVEFQKFFKKWGQFGFCFDVNHAIANSISPQEFVFQLKDKVEYIHLNATKPGNADHSLLIESGKETIQKIKPVFSLQKPLTIEVNIEKEKTQLLKKEIRFVRKMV